GPTQVMFLQGDEQSIMRRKLSRTALLMAWMPLPTASQGAILARQPRQSSSPWQDQLPDRLTVTGTISGRYALHTAPDKILAQRATARLHYHPSDRSLIRRRSPRQTI